MISSKVIYFKVMFDIEIVIKLVQLDINVVGADHRINNPPNK